MLGNDPPVFDQIIDLNSEENIDSMTINKNNINLNPSDNKSGGMLSLTVLVINAVVVTMINLSEAVLLSVCVYVTAILQNWSFYKIAGHYAK